MTESPCTLTTEADIVAMGFLMGGLVLITVIICVAVVITTRIQNR